MVHVKEQHMVFRSELDETHAEQRSAAEVEAQAGMRQRQFAGCQERVAMSAEVDDLQCGLNSVCDLLAEFATDFDKSGAQGLVTIEQEGKSAIQGVQVEGPAKA